MIHYVPICFILAIFGTLLVNPMFYYNLFKKRSEYHKDLEESKQAEKEGRFYPTVSKSKYSIFYYDSFPTALAVGQIIAFILTFISSALILYFLSAVVVSWSTILAYMWMPAFIQIITFLIYKCIEDSCFAADIEESIVNAFAITGCILLIIPVSIGIHKGVYNYLHPYEDVTFMEDDFAEYPTIDEATLLEKANLASGSSIYSPIYRNGNWIYPVVNNSSHVNSSGYLIVDATEENISFVAKEIVYSPWSSTTNNVNLTARRFMPYAVLFGKPTFQIDPETGDVYFCKFYGSYASFRAGRNVEGAMLINATTGECTPYAMNEIPDWVTGISF